MVKHVILWQLKDELSDAEKAAVKAGIKERQASRRGWKVWQARSRALWKCMSTSTVSPLPPPT